MNSVFARSRRRLFLAGMAMSAMVLAGCQQSFGNFGTGGPSVSRGEPVNVAMLLPQSGGPGDAQLSQDIERAARLAVADVSDSVPINITVYDTGGSASRAAARATEAATAGADVIVGPLRSDAAAAVGLAVANTDLTVLSFSNNTEVAGGNVMVLGYTFQNTANRVVRYASQRGNDSIVLVHANNLAGAVARDSVIRAAAANGATIAATIPYEFSQSGVVQAAPQVARAVRESGASAVLLTSDSAGALPIFAQLLPENGLDTGSVQLLGLTRWDIPPATAELSGLQGGIFALPDSNAAASFNNRFASSYGSAPHPLSSLGYDAIRAVAGAAGRGNLGPRSFLTLNQTQGAGGVFRFLNDGTLARSLAVAQIQDRRVVVIDPAQGRLGGAGF